MKAMFILLKRNLIYVISCMDIFGVSLIIPIFPQYLTSIGFSNFNIGVLNSIYSAVQFFASPIIGHMSDIFDSKRVLLASLLTCSLCYPLMGTAASFISVILIRMLIGFAKHTQLLCKNYIEESADEQDHIKGFGKLSGFTSVGYIVGPVIGGYIVDLQDGFWYMCCMTGFFFVVNALFVYCLPKPTKTNKHSLAMSSNFIHSFKNIPWSICWDLFLLKCLTVFAVFAFYMNYNQSVIKRYQVSSVMVGYSFSLQGVVRSVTGFSIHRIVALFPSNFDTLYKIKITYVVIIVSILSLYLASNFGIYLVCLIPLNICLCFIRIINHEALIERTKDHSKGIILGAFNNVTAIARFSLPLISGYIVDLFDFDSVYIISVVCLLIGILVISLHSDRRRVKTD